MTPTAASAAEETRSPVDLAARIAEVRERITRAARQAGRHPEEILLLGVTKFVPAERVAEALRAGLAAFGENYVQEARAKIPAVRAAAPPDAPPVEWHLIGRLQSNKAKYCPPLFSLIHSIDSSPLAEELGRAALKHGKTAQRVLVEVNFTGDKGRAGVMPEQTLGLCEAVAAIPGIRLEGLMGMAPPGGEPGAARPYFHRLRDLWDRLPAEHRLTLSMGMSGDFEEAIAEGATLVRVGTALFGARQQPPAHCD